jgi:hypothetical protein
VTRLPVRPVSLQDLHRIAETSDVVRQPAEHGNQLEVRFESA